jgi:hypothetical protein
MSAFKVDKAAALEIERIFRQSKCTDPVAALHERADGGNLFDDLNEAILHGGHSTEELQDLGKRRLEQVHDQLESRLLVEACERADYRSEDIFDVGGITFGISAGARMLLREHCLVFENGRFLLRGADGSADTLRSIVKRATSQEP